MSQLDDLIIHAAPGAPPNPVELWASKVDGTQQHRILQLHSTQNMFTGISFAAFSPTSKQIAFTSNRDDPKSDIYDVYLLDLDANGVPGKTRRITHDEGQHGHVHFSYDGKWLIFASGRGGINDEQPLYNSIQTYGELYAYRVRKRPRASIWVET